MFFLGERVLISIAFQTFKHPFTFFSYYLFCAVVFIHFQYFFALLLCLMPYFSSLWCFPFPFFLPSTRLLFLLPFFHYYSSCLVYLFLGPSPLLSLILYFLFSQSINIFPPVPLLHVFPHIVNNSLLLLSILSFHSMWLRRSDRWKWKDCMENVRKKRCSANEIEASEILWKTKAKLSWYRKTDSLPVLGDS